MKPRILVLYYTQTGQLRQILESILCNKEAEAEVVWAELQPVTPFPFPWDPEKFFDTMPETVAQVPVPMQALDDSVKQLDYDLVLLGYQPWFLHPSLPATSFLKSEDANFLKGKNVVTVIGSRNMWLNAQEKVKAELQRIGASLTGNIVLRDSNPNLLSLLSVNRWMFQGIKEKKGWVPAAGVQDDDINLARRFGPILVEGAKNKNWQMLQTRLQDRKAIHLNTGLVLLEQRGVKNFRFWSRYIREKGGPGALERKGRVKKFMRLLNTLVYILAPVAGFTAFIQKLTKRKKLEKDVAYFLSNNFEPDKI